MRIGNIVLTIIFLFSVFVSGVVLKSDKVIALDDSQRSIYKSGVLWYDSSLTGCSGFSSGLVDNAPINLPESVPEPYRTIFAEAAAAHDTDPLALTVQFLLEHALHFPDPPSPYGSGSSWSTSSADAKGPFQFRDAAWETHKQDGNGDGIIDVQDLTDAAYGAASYMKAAGVDIGSPLGEVVPPEYEDVYTHGTVVHAFASYRNGHPSVERGDPLGGAVTRVENGHREYLRLAAEAGVSAGRSVLCGGGGGLGISSDGFVFPIAGVSKSIINWCGSSYGNCHGSAWGGSVTYYAYDIWSRGAGDKLVAVRDGIIDSEFDGGTCVGKPQRSIWLLGEDNVYYFYQHMRSGYSPAGRGDQVSAGQEVGEVGPYALRGGGSCTNTSPHIHFAAMSYTTGKKSMYRGCSMEDCPNMDKLLDIASVLREAWDALPE